MASTPQHGVQGLLLTRLFTSNILILGVACVISMTPDLGRLFQKDPKDWTKFYKWAHHTWYCYWIPLWNLHIGQDFFMHDSNGAWKWWVIYFECASWFLEIMYSEWQYKWFSISYQIILRFLCKLL